MDKLGYSGLIKRNNMAYMKEITRINPGCIILLVDQSSSMSKPLVGRNTTKADVAAEIINNFIRETILDCTRNDGIRDYFYLGVIRYHTNRNGENVISPALGNLSQKHDLLPISEISDNPMRFEKAYETEINPDTGEPKEIEQILPIWCEPVAEGKAPMCSAFRFTCQILEKWVADHPNSFPPIVINITGGKPSDGNFKDIITEARKLMGVATTDGNALLFNVYLSKSSKNSIVFPANTKKLPDKFAKTMFETSSGIPDILLKSLEWRMKTKYSPRAHGLMCNVNNPEILITNSVLCMARIDIAFQVAYLSYLAEDK